MEGCKTVNRSKRKKKRKAKIVALFQKLSQIKTRNKLLMFVVVYVTTYTVVDILYSYTSLKYGIPSSLDPTLTNKIFEFGCWVFTTGAAITVTKTIKGEDKDTSNIIDFDVPLHTEDEYGGGAYEEIQL